MDYVAKSNFGVFGVGLVTFGEVLSERVIKALGAGTLQSLIERGAVEIMQLEQNGEDAVNVPAAERDFPDDEAPVNQASDGDEFVDVEDEAMGFDEDVVGSGITQAETKTTRKRGKTS